MWTFCNSWICFVAAVTIKKYKIDRFTHSLHVCDVFTSSCCIDVFIWTVAFLCVFVGQFGTIWNIRGSLEHISAFNPSINPISAVEAAVDDSLIQPDTGRRIHKGRKASNSILPTAHQQGWKSLMWMQKGFPIAKSNCNINQLRRIKSSF